MRRKKLDKHKKNYTEREAVKDKYYIGENSNK